MILAHKTWEIYGARTQTINRSIDILRRQRYRSHPTKVIVLKKKYSFVFFYLRTFVMRLLFMFYLLLPP